MIVCKLFSLFLISAVNPRNVIIRVILHLHLLFKLSIKRFRDILVNDDVTSNEIRQSEIPIFLSASNLYKTCNDAL